MTAGGGGERRAQWRERLRHFERSGQSVAAFCEAEGVSAWALYYWRRRLQEMRGGSGKSVALKRQVAGRAEGFIDVGETGVGEDLAVRSRQAGGGGVELRLELGGGLVLQIRRR